MGIVFYVNLLLTFFLSHPIKGYKTLNVDAIWQLQGYLGFPQ